MLAEFSGCLMAGTPEFLLGIKILKKDHIESYEIWKVMHLPTLSLEIPFREVEAFLGTALKARGA